MNSIPNNSVTERESRARRPFLRQTKAVCSRKWASLIGSKLCVAFYDRRMSDILAQSLGILQSKNALNRTENYHMWLDPAFANSKVKVAHTRLPSVGFRSWSRFLAVSLQMTWVINTAVGCHYFPPGLQLPSRALKGLLLVLLLGEQRHDGCEQFA